MLRAAARLAPANLVLTVWGHDKDRSVPIQIPCFDRAISMKLTVYNLQLAPPAQGAVFPVLERLTMSRCHLNTDALVRRCPRLRVLELLQCAIGTIKVHSPTIEELVVKQSFYTQCIHIMAPVLKRLTMDIRVWFFFTLSCFSAPMVEDVLWDCRSSYQNIGVGQWWRLLLTQNSTRTLHVVIDAKMLHYTVWLATEPLYSC
jgi:hypothetical protein